MRRHEEFLADIKLKEKLRAKQKREKSEKRLAAKKKREEDEQIKFARDLAEMKRQSKIERERQADLLTEVYSDDADAEVESNHSNCEQVEHVDTNPSPPNPKPVSSPPTKKKRSSNPKPASKKFPHQSNKMTNYVTKSTKSRIPKTIVTDSTESYATPEPNRKPTPSSVSSGFTNSTCTITPYTLSKTPAVASMNTQDTTVDMNSTCAGCGSPFHSCMECKWRKICMHKVLDYFEKVGLDQVTTAGVKKAYYGTFLIMLKASILDEVDLYECEGNIMIPDCMKSGSLRDCLEMMKFGEVYDFMMGRRVNDVQRHLMSMNGPFRGNCGPGERIVRVREGLL